MFILKFKYLFGLSILFGLFGLQSCSGGGGGTSSTFTNCTLGGGANVSVTGRATFDRVPLQATGVRAGALDFSNITQQPVKSAVVEVICNGVLSATRTDVNGNYSVSIPANTEGVFIRVKAQLLQTGSPSWDVSVSDEAQAVKLIFAMDGSPFNSGTASLVRNLNAASGWDGFNYSAPRVAAPFAILDTIYDAMQLVLAENTSAQFPLLDVKWSENSIDGTFYSNNTISVLGRTTDTDEFDEHVIAHEWGHYFQDAFSRDDSIGGNHGSGDILDMRVAFSEGFGNAFSAMVTGDSVYKDSTGLSNGFDFDVESNSCGSNRGWFSECSVQSIIYDIYDSNNAESESLELGFSAIYSVMAGSMPNTPAVTSLFSFITPIAATNNTASISINGLLSFQSIDPVSDEFGSGEAANNPGVTNQIPVITDAALSTTLSVSLCTTGENGGYNGLGVTRFIQFKVSQTKSYTFTATRVSGLPTTDPDIFIRNKGALVGNGESVVPDSEILTVSLLANQIYILELVEFAAYSNPNYVIQNDPNVDIACFSVTRTP